MTQLELEFADSKTIHSLWEAAQAKERIFFRTARLHWPYGKFGVRCLKDMLVFSSCIPDRRYTAYFRLKDCVLVSEEPVLGTIMKHLHLHKNTTRADLASHPVPGCLVKMPNIKYPFLVPFKIIALESL